MFAYWQQDLPGTTEKLDYAKLVQNIKDDKIKEISLQRKDENYNVKGTLSDGNKNFEALVPASDNEVQKQINEKAKDGKLSVVEYKPAEKTGAILSFLGNIIPFILMMGLLFFFMSQMQGGGGGKVMNFQKSKAKKLEGGETKVTFKDVAGADEEFPCFGRQLPQRSIMQFLRRNALLEVLHGLGGERSKRRRLIR